MSFRIFVGNLSYQVSDEDLREAFQSFGTVTYARVILDRETSKSRGFGFVEIEGTDAGREAIRNLDGKDLKGRGLRLKEAEPRAAGGPPGPDRAGAPPRRGPAPGGSAGGGAEAGDDASQRRRGETRRQKSLDEDTYKHGKQQGRPEQKERGGARNRFGSIDDDEDEDIDLFERDEEDFDYDLSEVEGVEFGDAEDEGQGLSIPIEPDDTDEGAAPGSD